jgi:hypothetical protein
VIVVSQAHQLELEFDEIRWKALEAEAARLGIAIKDLIQRAASAWLVDMAENSGK